MASVGSPLPLHDLGGPMFFVAPFRDVVMTTLTTAPAPDFSAKRSWTQLIGWGLFIAVLAWSWQGAEMNPLWPDP